MSRLYDMYARAIHAVLLARVPPDDADDLVHDVFLKAMRELHSLRDTAAFGGWLLRITRHQAHDFHRARRPMRPLPADVPARTTAGRERADEVLDAIRQLPEPYPELLMMRLVEGMSGLEIAGRSGLSHAAVRVNLHRGMKLLRERCGVGRPS